MVLYEVVSYIIEIIKILLVCLFVLNMEIKSMERLFLSFLGTTTMIGVASFCLKDNYTSVIVIFVGIIIIFTISSKERKIGIPCIVYIAISILDMINSSIIMLIFKLSPDKFLVNRWLGVPVNCISLVFIISIVVICLKKDKKININISKGSVAALIFSGVSIALYVAAVQAIGFGEEQSRRMNLVTVFISISGIVFIVISALISIKETKNRQLIGEVEMNNKLLEAQKDYYTMLLNKEEETKMFRHDIQNHLYCMQLLSKNKEYNALDEYINKITSEFSFLERKINTGNRLVDAILGHISSKYPNVKLTWKGTLPNNDVISTMDLCTIFSNLLSNAFEAAQCAENKIVNVLVKNNNTQLYCEICNQAKEGPIIKNGELVSTKNGKNHGYGMKNVKNCIEKNNGLIKHSYERNTFKVEIAFMEF